MALLPRKTQENNDTPEETIEQIEETTEENGSSVIEHTEKEKLQEELSENSIEESSGDYKNTLEKVNNQIGYNDAVELHKMLDSEYSDNAIKMLSVLRDIIVEILLCKKILYI